MSWIPLTTRRQANLDSTENALPDGTDSPLTLEDITQDRSNLILFMIVAVIESRLIHQH